MLNISIIQHFSVGDGDGIRTTVFCKGCNLRCPWCHNPENLTTEPVALSYKSAKKTEVLGRSVTVEEILPELLEDREFFRESGGGITFSGGEAMLQAEALVPFVKRLQEEQIPVLIDTAGCVPYSSFQKLNPYISGYLFDLKTVDTGKYRAIGGNLSLVKENLQRLQAEGVTVIVRIPLIPDFNTDLASIHAIGRCLCEWGIAYAELLPFHRLGSAKYEAMGLEYAYKNHSPLTKEELAEIESLYRNYISVKMES